MEYYFKQRQLLNDTDLAISIDHNKYSDESQDDEESEQYEDEHRNDFEDMTSESEGEPDPNKQQ